MNAPEHERSPTETLDLLFELVKDSPQADLRAVDAVDGKIVQVFAAAAVLLALPAAGNLDSDCWVVALLIGSAVAAFAYLALETIRGLWRREFRTTISPTQLWESYWSDDVATIKEALVADVAAGWPENDRHLRAKRKVLNRVLIALGVEAVMIGATLVASVLTT